MKIYLSPSTAGRYGGLLDGNLRYLPDYIQDELNKAKFKSSFNELWLTLSYPPMYVLPGVAGIEKQFWKFYKTFPYSRLNRRYRKIDITLQAPEFSEHLDKKAQSNYKHKFEIEEKYKNLSEVDLANILIDKYIQSAQIIESKAKAEDDFDFKKFEKVLLSVKQRISRQFLQGINKEQAVKETDDIISHALKIRDERKKINKPKDKRIRDLRVYYNDLPRKALYPYDYQYTEIFLNLLSRHQLMCPVYHHLYVQVVKTFEEGLRYSFAVEDWYTNGISVFDYNSYLKQSEKEKERMVIDAIVAGLDDIATLDKLDKVLIKKVTEEIKKTGLDTKLIFKEIENKRHKLTITYLSKSMEEQCPVFFELQDKKTNRMNSIQIGKADNSQIYPWLQKISLTKDKIKVKSGNSIRADVYLQDKPRAMEFNIADVLS